VQLKNICSRWLSLNKALGVAMVTLVEEYKYKASYEGIKGKFENTDYFKIGGCSLNEKMHINR
jgi:hypothetical protein